MLCPSLSDLTHPYQQTTPCILGASLLYFRFYGNIAQEGDKQIRLFCWTKLNDASWCWLKCYQNVMTQQQPVWLPLLNGSAVTGFSVGAAESIPLPLMWTQGFAFFFHVGQEGNKLMVAWLPAPWPSQVNHLALLCNTDHHTMTLLDSLWFCSLGIYTEKYKSDVSWVGELLKPPRQFRFYGVDLVW